MKKLLGYSLGLLLVCAASTHAADVIGDRLDIGSGNTLSGTGSTIAGGANNTVNGDYLAIGGGDGHTVGNTNWVISNSVIGGGAANTIDSMIATVAGGAANSIVGYSDGAFIGGGENNVATNAGYSFIGGGGYNTAKASVTTIGGGEFNIAEGALSTIPGGDGAVASNYGQFAYASGSFAGFFAGGGDAQMSIYVLRNSTTNSTQSELFLDGGSSRMAISIGSSWTFDILIVGRNNTGDSAHYQVAGGIENVNGTTALVGTPVKTVLGEDVPGWDVTVSADDTNDALRIQVAGDSSSIRWVATVRTVEVKE